MLTALLKLLKDNNIILPIVDIETGIYYSDNPEYRNLLKKHL